jgi:hypothetical protein
MHQAKDTVTMITVKMGQEDIVQVAKLNCGPHQLLLSGLTAVN